MGGLHICSIYDDCTQPQLDVVKNVLIESPLQSCDLGLLMTSFNINFIVSVVSIKKLQPYLFEKHKTKNSSTFYHLI